MLTGWPWIHFSISGPPHGLSFCEFDLRMRYFVIRFVSLSTYLLPITLFLYTIFLWVPTYLTLLLLVPITIFLWVPITCFLYIIFLWVPTYLTSSILSFSGYLSLFFYTIFFIIFFIIKNWNSIFVLSLFFQYASNTFTFKLSFVYLSLSLSFFLCVSLSLFLSFTYIFHRLWITLSHMSLSFYAYSQDFIPQSFLNGPFPASF